MQLYQGIAYCQVAICTFLVAIDLPVLILRIHLVCQTCIPVLKEFVPALGGCNTQRLKNQQAQSQYTFTAITIYIHSHGHAEHKAFLGNICSGVLNKHLVAHEQAAHPST